MHFDKPPPPSRKESSAVFLRREIQDFLMRDDALWASITALMAEALIRGWSKRGALIIYIPTDPAMSRPG